jgi:hypothetical protein
MFAVCAWCIEQGCVPEHRSGNVIVSTAAASSAAVWKLLLCEPTAEWLLASMGTYRLASCGISHRLRLLLSRRLHVQTHLLVTSSHSPNTSTVNRVHVLQVMQPLFSAAAAETDRTASLQHVHCDYTAMTGRVVPSRSCVDGTPCLCRCQPSTAWRCSLLLLLVLQ